VLGVVVLLRLQTAEQGMQVLLLAPDNSDADIRRRLRMRLATVQPGEAVPRL
jgi:toxin CptA